MQMVLTVLLALLGLGLAGILLLAFVARAAASRCSCCAYGRAELHEARDR